MILARCVSTVRRIPSVALISLFDFPHRQQPQNLIFARSQRHFRIGGDGPLFSTSEKRAHDVETFGSKTPALRYFADRPDQLPGQVRFQYYSRPPLPKHSANHDPTRAWLGSESRLRHLYSGSDASSPVPSRFWMVMSIIKRVAADLCVILAASTPSIASPPHSILRCALRIASDPTVHTSASRLHSQPASTCPRGSCWVLAPFCCGTIVQ